MGFVQKFMDRFRSKGSPLDVTSFDAGKPYQYTPTTDPTALLAVSWVYSCVRIISQAVKRTPLKVYQGNSDNEARGGPLYDILRRPNPFMSGRQLLEGTQTWLEIHGNAFWYLSELDSRGRPKEIWLLDSRNVQVVPDMKNMIGGYVYDVNGRQIPLDINEVMHFKTFNPFNPYMGLGTLQAVANTLETEQFRDQYDKSFFQNGAVLSGVLETPQQISDISFKRLKRELRTLYSGAKNAHKLGIFDQGLQYKSVTLSQRDMEFLEMAKFNRDRIFSAFGVPPAKVSILENANYSNSEEQDKTFWSETMVPKLSDIEERVNNELAPRYGNYTVMFENAVKEDDTALVQEVVSLANAKVPVLTTNELRERLGYDPITGGDDLLPTIPTPTPDNQSQQDQGDQPKQPEDSQESDQAKAWKKALKDTFDLQRVAYITRVKKEFTPDIQRFFDQQEDRIIQRLQASGKSGKSYNFTPDELFDQQAEDELLQQVLSILHITVSREAYEKATGFLDSDERFRLDNPTHMALIKELGKKITRINATTREQIVKTIVEGMRRGYSINQIAHGYEAENYPGIAGVFSNAKGYRAEMIARTESGTAYNMANLLAYEDLEQGKVLVLDGVDFDDACRAANGSVWTIEKARAKPLEHPNCVRAFAPHIDLGKEIPEWAKKRISSLHN